MNNHPHVLPQQTSMPLQTSPMSFDLGNMIQAMIVLALLVGIMHQFKIITIPMPKKVSKILRGEKREEEPKPKPLPQARKPVVERKLTVREEEERREQSRAQAEETENRRIQLVKRGEEIAEEAGGGTRFIGLETGWEPVGAVPKWWFEDAKKNRIRAGDIEELRRKLTR